MYLFLEGIQKLFLEEFNSMLFDLNPPNKTRNVDRSKLTKTLRTAQHLMSIGFFNEKCFLVFMSGCRNVLRNRR